MMIRSNNAADDGMRKTQEIRRLGGWLMRSKLAALVRQKQVDEKRSISQKEIADAIGVRPPTISAWMDEERLFSSASSDVIGRLLAWGGWTANELLDFELVARKAKSNRQP